MKIFLDTANVEEVAKHFLTGLINGVTTNPTLIRKSGRNPDEVYKELADIGVQDISMEVYGTAQECLKKVFAFQILLVTLQLLNCL